MKHKPTKISDLLKKGAKNCPRCGTGVRLAAHKDRLYCGKCKYTEFLKS